MRERPPLRGPALWVGGLRMIGRKASRIWEEEEAGDMIGHVRKSVRDGEINLLKTKANKTAG